MKIYLPVCHSYGIVPCVAQFCGISLCSLKKIILFISFIYVDIASAQLIYQNVLVQYDSAWTYKNLQLIPIKFKTDPDFIWRAGLPKNVISLQEAMRSGKVEIKEMNFNKDADVGVLLVKNNTKKNILINSGELITGGKQDRVSAETIIIPSGKEENYLSVFCVEKGRWSKKAKPFTYSGSVDLELRRKIDIAKRQADIWHEIDRQFTNQNKKADTWPYLDLYQAHSAADSLYLNYFLQKMKNSDSSYAGFIAIAGKRIIACEVFATEDYLLNSYPAMLIGFIHSVLPDDDIPSVKYPALKAFADPLFQSEKSQNEFLAAHGKADKWQGKTIHLIAYAD